MCRYTTYVHVCKDMSYSQDHCTYVFVYYDHMFLCCQVQAVTIEGPGNFSSPATVTVGGSKASDNNSVVIGVPVGIVVVIILLTVVAGLLSAYCIR